MAEEISTIQALRTALSAADRTAFLVEARVIRRFIRERYGVANVVVALPHTHCQVVNDEDIRKFAHPDELGLDSYDLLPKECLLICEPERGELDHWPLQELKQQVWRRLFHATLDRELKNEQQAQDRVALRASIAAFGQVEFDEAHYVLRTELCLMVPNSRDEAWRELAAIYFEMHYFEPDLLPIWFPSLQDSDSVQKLLARGLNVQQIFRETQLEGAPAPELISHAASDEDRLLTTRRNWSLAIGVSQSDQSYQRLLRKRDRALERGNTVFAIACALRATQRANTEGKRLAAEKKARDDVRTLVHRLRNAIAFDKQDKDEWQSALWELTKNSVHGFWNVEKRLLYDLQKVCLDHERVTFKVDLVKWVISRGKRPLKRPLKSLREVAMAKHLASAASRLTHVRLSGNDRNNLTERIEHAAELAETQMRERMRPVLAETLVSVQLLPASVPEQVACEKLVEESLDCIAERGYLTMGYLRDAISRNDLKLPDIQDLREVWHGDQLLRADDQLDLALDGVYRRGEFYLRWLQVVSSLFFGTRMGRFVTMYLIIPFGGAVVIVEGTMHVVHMFQPRTNHAEATTSHPSQEANEPTYSEKTNSEKINSEQGVAETSVAEKSIAEKSIAPQTNVERPSSDGLTPNTNRASDLPTDVASGSQTRADDVSTEATDSSPSPGETESTVSIPPKTTDEVARQILSRQTPTFSLVLILGLLLMALIHSPWFQKFCVGLVFKTLRLVRAVLLETPLLLLKLPIFLRIWMAEPFVRLRRFVLGPAILAVFLSRFLPWLCNWQLLDWWLVGVLTILVSALLNSRIGRDAQELTRDWLEQSLHQLQARFVFAFISWVIDFFRLLMNTLERVLYAVDEWLRFHSDENLLVVLAKAILGVAWSFVSFLIRIYVNLLIEPTFHPVKHFPVVTVAHKIFLPALIMLEGNMVHFLGQYMGTPLARSITWFNMLFLPGFFGFVVWELKGNWKLYLANRTNRLMPVAVGSHGETIARLLRPGFHSGTLPKIFRKLRRLEHRDASLSRFTSRRSTRGQLHHVEKTIQSFVERELISLLKKSDAWRELPLLCGHIEAASNSFCIELKCSAHEDSALRIRIQEQSGWIVASVSQAGWLKLVPEDQRVSFENALDGFYRKCGIDLVREKLEADVTKSHPYDIDFAGLLVWPSNRSEVEVVMDLHSEGKIVPQPELEAANAGFEPIDRKRVLFSATTTEWKNWENTWPSGQRNKD